MARRIRHRVPSLGAVVLLTLSIAMGLQVKAVARHQLLDQSPFVYCGMELVCHE